MFGGLFKKTKKKLTDSATSLGAVANEYRKTLGSYANNTKREAINYVTKPQGAPDWMKATDSGLRKFSQSAENIPKFNFASKVKNPVGRFAAEIPQTIMNIPSRTVSGALKDYGKTKATPSYLVKRGAEAANIGVDIGSIFAGGGTIKKIATDGFKKASKIGVMDALKTGAKRGAKEGLIYGGTSGALSGAQEGENLREQGANALKSGVTGAIVGTVGGAVLGGTIAGGGRAGSKAITGVKNEARKTSTDIMNFKNPYKKRIVTKVDHEPNYGIMIHGKPQMVPVAGTERTVIQTIREPFKPKSILGKVLTTRPGLNIQDVNSLKPKVVSTKVMDFNNKIALKNKKAQEVIARQKQNQRLGLDKAEKGFVPPQRVKAPQKAVLEVEQSKQQSFPNIEEFVNKKQTKESFPSVKALIENKKKEIKNDSPFKGNEFGPFNKFQEKAYRDKGERIDALRDVLSYPTELMRIGYKKREVNLIGKDQANHIIKLGNLGYPKKQIDKIIQNIPKAKEIIKKKVPWGQLKNYYEKKEALNTNFLNEVDPSSLKDINSLMGSARDVYRNFDVVFGDNSKVKKEVLGSLDKAKGKFIDEQDTRLGDLWNEVVKKYGIKEIKTFFGFKYGDRSSEYVQKVGENVLLRPLRESDIPDNIKRQINFSELKSLAEKSKDGDWRISVGKKLEEMPDVKKEIILTQLKQISPKNWNKIVEAVSWFRSKFDEMLPELNKVREDTYPTHPLYPESTKTIPHRDNYFPHSLERDGIFGLKNLFDTPANIDPSLAVMSEYTKPKSKFLGFAQQRTGDKTEYDAVKGMKNYIRDFSFAKHIDPQIQRLRGMDEETKELIKNSGGAIPERIGLAEELSKKFDPIQKITATNDPKKIKDILMEHGASDSQSDWMSKELANIGDYEKVKTFIKEKTAKNKEDIFGRMSPSAAAEKSDNKLNNFLKFLDNYASDLAGKTNPFDRPNQDAYARKSFKLLRSGLSRIKANAVLGNVGSAVSQFFSLPPGIASAGTVNTTKGIKDSFVGIFKDDLPINKSNFLKERYFDGFSKFDESFLATPKKFAAWMMTFGDEVSAKVIWNSHYRKALNEKISDPVSYADDWTRKMVGGRGIGEVPLMQKSLMYQVTNPFQLEVTNYWYALRDLAKHDPSKFVLAKKLTEAFIVGHIMNRIVKEVRGSDVIFDPIQAIIDGYEEYEKEDNKKVGALKTGGRIAGEFFSNAPGLPGLPTGQTLANIYPKYGKEVFGYKLPARNQFFGEGDPTRFGSGGVSDVITGGIQDPLYKIIPPFGGSQIKKTTDGVKTLLNGYAENAAGKVMTPVERNATNVMRGVLFGKNATGEMQDYFDNKQTPLSEEQTEKFKIGGNKYFDEVMLSRASDNTKEKLKKAAELGTTIDEPGDIGDGIHRLEDGNFYVPNMLADTKTFKTEKLARYAIVKEDFMSSDEKMRQHDNEFWYKKNGEFKVETQDERTKKIAVANANLEMDRAFANDDMENWAVAADKKIESINKYISTLDPIIDQDTIDSLTLEKENLMDKAEKYIEQGGFKKGSKGKKLEEKYRYPLLDKDFMQIAGLLGGSSKKVRISRRPTQVRFRRLPGVSRRRKR